MMDGFWIDESPDAIVVCDKEGKLLVLNEKTAKLFEASGGKALLDKSMFDQSLYSQRLRHYWQTPEQSLIQMK